MCLTQGTIEKDPRQGSPECLNQWSYKDWPKRPSDHRLQEAGKKDSDRAITPAMEAVCVPEHLTLPGSLQAKQLCHLHAQLLQGQQCHRQKKSWFCVCRFASVVSHSLWPCRLWPARFLYQRGSLGKNIGAYWPILLTIPF